MEEVRVRFPKVKDRQGNEKKQKTKAVLQNFKPSLMLQRPDEPGIVSSSEEENEDIADPPPINVLEM